MDIGTIGWIAVAWFGIALVVSIALGAFLGQVTGTMGEADLASAAVKRKGMRFMRTSAAKSVSARNIQGNTESRKHNVKQTG